MKNLYVNGCSFTAGHVLKEEESWPYLLAKKLLKYMGDYND